MLTVYNSDMMLQSANNENLPVQSPFSKFIIAIHIHENVDRKNLMDGKNCQCYNKQWSLKSYYNQEKPRAYKMTKGNGASWMRSRTIKGILGGKLMK